MTDIPIEQALYGGQGPGGYQFLARSPGFLDDWLPEAERLCTAFGDRPAGVSCPGCVFAQPFGRHHVAVVQAADQGSDDTGRPGALAFRLLVLPRTAYAGLGGDPFLIADRFPPPWSARGVLPSLTWEGGPPPPRTLAQVQQLLQRPGGESLFADAEVPRGGSQVLLGGCQALLDGAKLVFERPAPDTDLLRGLWTLLPTTTRTSLWPASFALGNALHFDALAVPRLRMEDYPGYKTEQEAADYPEGRYELSLQTAAESGTQRDLDALFARRSQNETFRILVILVVVLVVLTAAIRFLPNFGGVAPAPTAPDTAHGRAVPDLPPVGEYPTLVGGERDRLARALDGLARQLDVAPPAGASLDQLVEAIDRRLGTPDPARDPGPLAAQGPPQRQLRVLLWKHGLAEYRDPGLNPVELVERLQQRVFRPPAGKKETAP
jgi:hypothetical protein